MPSPGGAPSVEGLRVGARHHIPEIVIGALILAGVTSLPNAVSALYLAVRRRGAAMLSIP